MIAILPALCAALVERAGRWDDDDKIPAIGRDPRTGWFVGVIYDRNRRDVRWAVRPRAPTIPEILAGAQLRGPLLEWVQTSIETGMPVFLASPIAPE